jgi:arylsulfatase A-like enzyme
MRRRGSARHPVLCAALCAGGLVAGFAACSQRARPAPALSAMLITVDTLRPNRLSCYGYSKQKTVAIDSLARDGVLFEQAVCDIPWTTGSMSSVMTGTFSTQHGVHLSNERLAMSRLTLAAVLKEHGYQTGAVIGSFPLAALYGLNQGFESYDDDFTQPFLAPTGGTPSRIHKVPPPGDLSDLTAAAKWADEKMRNDAYRSDAEVSDRAIQWLQAPHAKPFFLWVHYFGPHERLYDIAETALSWQEPRIVADYDGDLQKTNAAVQRLLAAVDELGLERQLLVVLHADHGQSLGEHQYVGHSMDLYDASIRVPLLMRLPGRIVAGGRVPALVRNVDIMPTILDVLGVPVPSGLNGRSLVPALEGRTLPAVPAYSETYIPTIVLWPIGVPNVGTVLGPMSRHAVRTEHWKLIESQLAQPCVKGISAYRTARVEMLDQWQLREASALAPQECDALRVDELYDLQADPGELTNVAVAHPELVQQLGDILRATTAHKGTGETMTLSPADKERLRSLGYVPGEG